MHHCARYAHQPVEHVALTGQLLRCFSVLVTRQHSACGERHYELNRGTCLHEGLAAKHNLTCNTLVRLLSAALFAIAGFFSAYKLILPTTV